MARWQPLRNPEYILVNRIVERLAAEQLHNIEVWRARCPAHRDRGHRLLIINRLDQRPTLVCLHGCRLEAILKAMGLPADAWQPRYHRAHTAGGRRRTDRREEMAHGRTLQLVRVPRLGQLQQRILGILQEARHVTRDRLPARLWGWPAVVRWVRTRGDLYSYPTIDRKTYQARQASLTRALKTLARYELITTLPDGQLRITPHGRAAINGVLTSPTPQSVTGLTPAPQAIHEPRSARRPFSDVDRAYVAEVFGPPAPAWEVPWDPSRRRLELDATPEEAPC